MWDALLILPIYVLCQQSFDFSPSYNDSMLWGTYRPNLYFGISTTIPPFPFDKSYRYRNNIEHLIQFVGTRTRSPQTLLTGLAWFGASDMQSRPWENVRHTCREEDRLEGYAWAKHDGRQFGVQTIKDQLNNVAIKTEFVKLPGAATGGDWVVRISGEPIDKSAESIISMIFYAAFDHHQAQFEPIFRPNDETVQVDGHSPSVGNFALVGKSTGNTAPSFGADDLEGIKGHLMSMNPRDVWKMNSFIPRFLVESANKRVERLGRNIHPSELLQIESSEAPDLGNVVLFQHTFTGAFTVEYAYVGDESPKTTDFSKFFGDSLSKVLKQAEEVVDSKFQSKFELEEKGYSANEISFGKMLIGNMLGGLGYFYGTSIEDRARQGFDEEQIRQSLEVSDEDDYFGGGNSGSNQVDIPLPNPQPAGPFSLFTGVPSRPFFPRGFLWDSGFDHHLIEAFDSEISLDIIKNWAALIDDDGWLPREQILGDEARSKVPAEFQVQYPDYANPPTLVTALEKQVDLVELYSNTGQNAKLQPLLEFMQNVYPKFKKQYDWFHATQMGAVDQYDYNGKDVKLGFKWRGRKGKHILTSGMDDYPRSSEAHPGDLHVDLLSWVSYFANSLERVAKVLGLDNDVEIYKKHKKQLSYTLDAVHWDDESGIYADVSFDPSETMIRAAHPGYVSIMPVMLGLVPKESPKLKALLELIHDPNHFWSDFGICSLSKQDPLYGQDENYWRGPIWINMNYLLLHSLHRNYVKSGPYKDLASKIYKELRQKIVSNVYEDYERSGYVWEQYSCDTGHGSRSHPFTGWTSLVLLIMSEKY